MRKRSLDIAFGSFDVHHRCWHFVITLSPVEVRTGKDSDQRVCMSVCLFVCLSTRVSQNHTSKFNKIYVDVTCGLGSVLLRRQCNMLCNSSYVDGVMFSYDRPNRPESKTTRIFRLVRQVAATEGRSLPSPIASFFM